MTKNSQYSRLLPLLEVVAFAAIAIISKKLVDPYLWRFSGPITLVGTLAILTTYMHVRGEYSWRDLGLIKLPKLKSKLLVVPQALFAFVVILASGILVAEGGQALGFEFMGEIPDGVEERWGDVYQNLPIYLLWMGIIWTAAAFGEEMFFRGFLLTRLSAFFGNTKVAAFLGVLLAAAFFGWGHMYYQGLRGFFTTGAIAFSLGILYFAYKRNLWPLVIAHGAVDSLGFTAMYMGWDF